MILLAKAHDGAAQRGGHRPAAGVRRRSCLAEAMHSHPRGGRGAAALSGCPRHRPGAPGRDRAPCRRARGAWRESTASSVLELPAQLVAHCNRNWRSSTTLELNLAELEQRARSASTRELPRCRAAPDGGAKAAAAALGPPDHEAHAIPRHGGRPVRGQRRSQARPSSPPTAATTSNFW